MRFDLVERVFTHEDEDSTKIAFAGADKDISWSYLKNLSDAIYRLLRDLSVPQGHPVIVHGDKEIFFLASLLACYRAELPFVPVTPELPQQRITNIIAQTGSQVCIQCGEQGMEDFSGILIRSDLSVKKASAKFEALHPEIAYILFTSGSTGTPKGVLITYQNVHAFIKWFAGSFPVSKETVFVNQASFLFDISLADFFGALQTGGTAVFNTSAQVKDGTFFQRILDYGGNYWNSTPSFLHLTLLRKEFSADHFASLKCFTLAGEMLRGKLVAELKSRFPQSTIINAYGPTETCIYTSRIQIGGHTPLTNDAYPIAEYPPEQLRLKENHILVVSEQIGKGYLAGGLFQREFDTGDTGAIQNGFLYCTGRSDGQIKLNGYRIELAEISCAIEKLEGVLRAACIPVRIGDSIQRLAAFVSAEVPLKASFVKSQLRSFLPEYMIPSEIIFRKEFPLTTSGKTDLDALEQIYRRDFLV